MIYEHVLQKQERGGIPDTNTKVKYKKKSPQMNDWRQIS